MNKKKQLKNSVIRIMVFGAFDVLHKGHDNLFEQARTLAKLPNAPYLIVSVARDKNVQRIKGRLPLFDEQQRLHEVKNHPLVDHAILGAISSFLPHIVRQKPNIIALGYDQTHYVSGLKKALNAVGLTVRLVRLKPYKPNKYKSSLIKKKLL